jgi:hypothetical protein
MDEEGGSEVYRGEKIRWIPRPRGAFWKGRWMAWVDLDKTYRKKASDLDTAIQSMRDVIDKFLED